MDTGRPDLAPHPYSRRLIDTGQLSYNTFSCRLDTFYMSELKQQLERLGLSQYFEVFTAEGFDTWETVLDITESDL